MFWAIVIGFIVLCFVVAAIQMSAENEKMSKMKGPQKRFYQEERAASGLHGPPNSQMVCPHCETKGKVHTKSVKQKKGVSGGKATGALLTGGVSLLATGLSRKEQSTEAYCRNCRSVWHF